jgi:hypothetical protein
VFKPVSARIVVLVIALMTTAGCVPMSTLQTARTLGQGEQRVLVGGSLAVHGPWNGVDVWVIPYPEIDYRRGVLTNLDVGARFIPNSSFTFDAKYQFYDDNGLALAAGLGIMPYRTFDSGHAHAELIIPGYISYDISDRRVLYFVPKAHVLFWLHQDYDRRVVPRFGTSAGLRFGDRVGVFAEATVMVSAAGRYLEPTTVGTAAVFWEF